MCAPRRGRGRARRHGLTPVASVGVSPPNLFLLFFPVCHCRTKSTEGRHRFARLCQAIHAEAALVNASTGICPLQSSMDHRVKRGGDDPRQWRGIARVRRRAARTVLFCQAAIFTLSRKSRGWGIIAVLLTDDLTFGY